MNGGCGEFLGGRPGFPSATLWAISDSGPPRRPERSASSRSAGWDLRSRARSSGAASAAEPARAPGSAQVADVLQVIAAADSFDRIRADLCAIFVGQTYRPAHP